MHVSIVTETFPPDVNGVAMTLHRLASGLRLLGHTVSIVRPRLGHRSDADTEYPTLQVPGFRFPWYPEVKLGFPCGRRLEKHWRVHRPDVLYIATEGPLGISAIGAAERLTIPATSGFHTHYQEYLSRYWLKGVRKLAEAYLRWAHNRTRTTFAPSPHTAADLEAMGIRPVRLLGRGVDASLFSPGHRSAELRASWALRDGAIAAINVSRIAIEKNIPLIIDAFRLLRSLEPGAATVWVGDGPELPRLRREYPEFHYAGLRRGADLAAHYASGDLFLFPSTTETFGNVVTEAMASGLIVVAYDYAAAHLHIRDGQNGFLAPFNDREAYLAAVRRAWENRGRWPEIRRAARATAETLSWDAIVHRFSDNLTEAAGPLPPAA